MPRYVALLRGINIGGHTVKMDRLRAMFEELGFGRVETFIASGNVIFDSPSRGAEALERRIASHLERSLGFAVATFLRTHADLARVLEHEVLGTSDARSVYIGFLSATPSMEAHARLMSHRSRDDEFHVEGREVFWLCRTAMMSESPFFRVGLEKALGMTVTVRNVKTIANVVERHFEGREPQAAGMKRTEDRGSKREEGSSRSEDRRSKVADRGAKSRGKEKAPGRRAK